MDHHSRTLEELLDELDQALAMAREQGDAAAMAAIVMNQAELLGFVVHRHLVELPEGLTIEAANALVDLRVPASSRN